MPRRNVKWVTLMQEFDAQCDVDYRTMDKWANWVLAALLSLIAVVGALVTWPEWWPL